jgi:sugar lactone lactonase YvrE
MGRSRGLAWTAAVVAAASVLFGAGPADATFQFVSSWGSAGSGNGQFSQPRGIAVAQNGDVYVADSLNNRVQHFTSDGTFIGQWGGAGAGDGQFQSAYDVAIGPAGDVFAVDRNNHRVQRFTPAGAFVSKFGTVGSGPGQLSHPSELAIDGAGNVYVADYDNHRIVVFDANGAFVRTWGASGTADGQFNLPDGIAAEANGNVYVVDGTNRVQKFASDGTFLLKWGTAGTADGQFQGAVGVATGPGGTVFVSDSNNRRIQRFSGTGTFIEKFGSSGTGPGNFNRPLGVAATAAGDVYVGDIGGQKIVHFREVAGALPSPNAGKTVNVRVVKGTVRIKRRGSRKFVRLTAARQIPVGSTIDARRGTVEITSAADLNGTTQTGQFYKGVFVVAQKRSANPITDLKLTGTSFKRCSRAARASKGGPVRRLWGTASGKFRTKGKYASAAVRGTTWLTEDRCTGTLVRVTVGSVTVRDQVKRRSIVVTAPGKYFARPRGG